MEQELKEGQTLYYARVLPRVDVFDVEPVKIHKIKEYLLCTSQVSSCSYIFGKGTLGKYVFENKYDAESYVADARNEYYATHKRATVSSDSDD